MVIIRETRDADGIRYELADFPAYVSELRKRGIEPPAANYRIFVSLQDESTIRRTVSDFEEQIARFFQLGPASEIDYRIIRDDQSTL